MFTFSAFWWNRTDSDKTVVLSSRPAAKFFQVLSSLAATDLNKENVESLKIETFTEGFSPDVTSCVVAALHQLVSRSQDAGDVHVDILKQNSSYYDLK